jgi:hypothetical protein
LTQIIFPHQTVTHEYALLMASFIHIYPTDDIHSSMSQVFREAQSTQRHHLRAPAACGFRLASCDRRTGSTRQLPMANLKVVQQLSIPRSTHEVYETGTEMSDKPKEKQRLLIVDDSKVIRVTARKILRDHFETIEAVDGENAWEILSSDLPVSLVVSDLTMPNLDVFGLLKRIRSSHLPTSVNFGHYHNRRE